MVSETKTACEWVPTHWRTDDAQASRFRDEVCESLSAVRCESGTQESYERRSGPDHLLADGYDEVGLRKQIEHESDIETFFAQAPALHPNRSLIKGVVCGVRVEDIEDPLMQEIRYLDKLIDELAKGKTMEKILRQ